MAQCQALLEVDITNGLDWSDHAALCLSVRKNTIQVTPVMSLVIPSPKALLLPKQPNHLDLLLGSTLLTSELPDDAMLCFYGSVYYSENPITVYTNGSCLTVAGNVKQAGAGVFLGIKHKNNVALRVPGLPTNNRAELCAVLWLVTHVDPQQPLVIFTDSQYVIHSVCHWAASNA